MFIELVKDALVEYSYDAELAGLSYTFESQADGILLTVDGYNDKLHVLAKVVVEKMKTLKVDEERFRLIMDQVRRSTPQTRIMRAHPDHCPSAKARSRQLPPRPALQSCCFQHGLPHFGDCLDS